jgi:tetratricopeptide (TPR) repeat protein
MDHNLTYRLLRGLAFFLLVAAVLAILYGGVAYAAWQRGQTIRAERVQTDLQEQLQKQMVLAESDMAAGNYALAVRRLEWVLGHDAGYTDAQGLRDDAYQSLNRLLTPAATAVIAAMPATATPPFQATPSPAENDASAALAAVRSLLQEEAWENAIDALINFQGRFPNYARRETDQMLYDTYVYYGVELLYSEQVELGLHYLERAERLGDLQESVGDQRVWAKLYLQGIGFYGVNWAASVFYFRDLCLAAPFFHNACDRLREALVAYGDQYAAAHDWCPAVPLYTEAVQHSRDPLLSEKLGQAREGCLAATPTPLPEEESEFENGNDDSSGDDEGTRP